MKNKVDALTEIILEECWQISCRLMREIEQELEGKYPVTTLLTSQNLANKWLLFAARN